MRVIAGSARSLRLSTPKGIDTRPTADRIKETLFNMIHPELPGSIVLDLFAGSGGLGIEALSRGAEHAYFIENNHHAIKCITENLLFTKLDGRATLLNLDAISGIQYLSTLPELKDKYFRILFIDPPYLKNHEKKILDLLAQQKYINSDTVIILETERGSDPAAFLNEAFFIEKKKKYKTNQHLFIKKARTQ